MINYIVREKIIWWVFHYPFILKYQSLFSAIKTIDHNKNRLNSPWFQFLQRSIKRKYEALEYMSWK